MATKETVDALVNLVVEITKRDVNDLVKDSKWGEYNFDDCRDDLEAAFAVVRPLPELPLESILDSIAVGFNAQLSNLSAAINNLTEFTVKQDAPEQNRDVLANAPNSQAQATWSLIAPWIGYLFFQAGDVSEGLKKIRESQGSVDDALVKL